MIERTRQVFREVKLLQRANHQTEKIQGAEWTSADCG